MRFSVLQKHLLILGLNHGGRCPRGVLDGWYAKTNPEMMKRHAQNVVTKAVENLTDKGLLVAEGVRTQERWYIKSVRVTALGKKFAKRFQGQQLTMRLK